MKNILNIALITIIAFAFFSCLGERKQDPTVKYLDVNEKIFTKGDTLRINGKKYIKIYGITHCKYGCPVLIEVD